MNEHYGHPKDSEESYYPDIYCGLCNKIPFKNGIDPETEERTGKVITELIPVPFPLPITGNNADVLMVCESCARLVVLKMKERLLKSL